MRNCDGCTMCCYFMAVPETDSVEYEYCTHCNPGVGCMVYDKRSGACRNTNCLWYNQEQIPDYLRPDRLGVMFELPALCQVMLGYVKPETPNAWKSRRAQTMIQKIMQAGHPVIVTAGKGSRMVHFVPPGWNINQVVSEVVKSHNKCKELITHGGS